MQETEKGEREKVREEKKVKWGGGGGKNNKNRG
jgi:hypothetical protein